MTSPSARTSRPSERREQPARRSLVDTQKTSVLAPATGLVRHFARTAPETFMKRALCFQRTHLSDHLQASSRRDVKVSVGMLRKRAEA